MVMASFGASMALRSLLEFLFTSQPAYFSPRDPDRDADRLSAIRLTPDQIFLLALTAVLVVAHASLHDPERDRPRHARGVGESDARRASPASMSTASSARPG